MKVSFFACKCVFCRPENNAKEWKVLKCKNQIYQWIELKE